MSRTLLSVGVVGAVLAAGAGVGALARPDTGGSGARSGERRVSVQSSVAVCPHPVTDGVSRSSVAAAVPPATAGDTGGEALLTDLGNDAKVRQRIDRTGTSAVLAVTSGAGTPVVGRAQGSVAPGFTVQQLTGATTGTSRGLASTACSAPGTGFWFVGTSTAASRRTSLYLTNTEKVPAAVDVLLYGPKGRVGPTGGRHVLIGPGRQREVLLGAVAPGVTDVSVNVVVREGRVAAALRDQEVSGKTAKGVDWLPAAGEPARRVIVPPAPAGAAQRLSLLAPGDKDGTAQLRLIAKDGAFTPVGAESVELVSGRVTSVDISKASRGEPVAVAVDSEVPVLAGMRVVRGTGSPDVGFVAGSAPLVNAAVVPGSRSGAKLYLTAPGTEARATVTTMASGAPQEEDVTVPAGTTLTLALKSPSAAKGGAFGVVVTPAAGSGELYGSWAQFAKASGAEMFTVQPLADDAATVLVPRVGHDLSAGTSRESKGGLYR